MRLFIITDCLLIYFLSKNQQLFQLYITPNLGFPIYYDNNYSLKQLHHAIVSCNNTLKKSKRQHF